jgi:hypothetical protein
LGVLLSPLLVSWTIPFPVLIAAMKHVVVGHRPPLRAPRPALRALVRLP